jgi:broad specificity phosphatase PhoE
VTTFLLVRHAAHDLLGKVLAGRGGGLGLNELGRRQAQELVGRLAETRIGAIYCSPQQRAQETAAPLAAQRGIAIGTEQAFDEIDFGEWTGLPFERLREQGEAWRLWVEQKSIARPPGGEAFANARRRAVGGVERLLAVHPDETVVVVSHGDILKSILATVLGISLDHLQRFDLAPASLSVIAMGAEWAQVKLVNGMGGPAGE